MKKLKREIFLTIYIILTISILGILSYVYIENYNNYKQEILNNLNNAYNMTYNNDTKINNDSIPPEEKNNNNMIFMDNTVYTVILNDNNDIVDVINHSNNTLDKDTITKLAEEILNNDIKDIKYNNLLFNKYSYKYEKNKELIIIDNTNITNKLIKNLIKYIIIFILLNILVIVISKILTKKITKPIIETFTKQKNFIADASHELKTPLSVIIASTENLKENPKEKKWLNNIEYESNRMSLLIKDLLDLASSEKEIEKIYKEENLSKIIELSILPFEGIMYEKNIKFKYSIEDNIKYKINSDSIKQLVEILLDNAIKHTKKNDDIFVELKKINNNIIFNVKNKGISIKEEDKDKIFERFYRVDKSRNRSENRYGLGLAIAKNITENHKGKISVQSIEGYTIFNVIFK